MELFVFCLGLLLLKVGTTVAFREDRDSIYQPDKSEEQPHHPPNQRLVNIYP